MTNVCFICDAFCGLLAIAIILLDCLRLMTLGVKSYLIKQYCAATETEYSRMLFDSQLLRVALISLLFTVTRVHTVMYSHFIKTYIAIHSIYSSLTATSLF